MLNLSRLRLHPHTPEDHRRPLNRLSGKPLLLLLLPPSLNHTNFDTITQPLCRLCAAVQPNPAFATPTRTPRPPAAPEWPSHLSLSRLTVPDRTPLKFKILGLAGASVNRSDFTSPRAEQREIDLLFLSVCPDCSALFG
ncbi:hypothetical protein MHYP_G00007610 [Metynnis hypsauchen]